MVWNQVFFRYKYKKFEPPSLGGGVSIGGSETLPRLLLDPSYGPD